MLKYLLFALLFFTLFFLNRVHPAFADPPDPLIKIGVALPLSGKLAHIGKSQLGGLTLAAKDLNDRSGIKLQIIPEDTQGDPKTAVNVTNKLIRQDKVDLFFTSFTHIVLAVQEIVKASGIPMLYQASISNVAAGNERFFRDYGDVYKPGESLARYALSHGHKRFARITLENDACRAANQSFDEVLKKGGGELLEEESYAPGELDFRALLLRVKAKKPQALLLCAWTDTGQVIRQQDELHMLNIPSYHSMAPLLPANDTPEVRALLEKNHAISSWHTFVTDEATPDQKKLVDRIETEIGETPQLPDAAIAYDDLFAIVEALKPCRSTKSIDQKCFVEKFAATNFNGIAGPLKFDAERLAERPVILIEVKHGKWQTILSY